VEGMDEFGTEHLRKQFGASLTVSVLAGERAPVSDDEISGLVHELAEAGNALFGFEIEIDSRVHAGVAEVSVEHSVIGELGHEVLEVAEVVAEFVRGHGCIFPTLPTQGLTGDV